MPLNIEAYRKRLQTALAQVKADTTESTAAAATVVLDQSSVGRLSRMDAMQQQAMAKNVLQRLAMQQRKLEAALGRMELGTYGLCCLCHDAVETKRLDADPAAVFCRDCEANR